MALELTQEQKDAGWQVKNLGDITSKIGSGATPRGGKNVYLETGAALIRSQNVHDHKLNLDDVARIDENAEQQLKSVLVQNYDVLLNITGDSIARCAYVPQDIEIAYVNQHVSIIRTNPSEVNYKYLQKYLVSPKVKKQLLDMSDGGTRKALTKGALEGFEIVIPPIGEQKRIAEILGSLDDKIEANSRLLDSLYKLLHELYVFRLSQGGQKVPLTGIADFVNGKAFTKNATGTGRMVVRIAELNGGPGASTVYNEIPDVDEKHLVNPGEILMSWSGTLGVFLWSREQAIINQHIFKVVPKPGYPLGIVYCAIQSVIEKFQAIAQDKATTMGHIKRGDLETPVLVPSNTEELEDVFSLISTVEQENITLAKTRDHLIRYIFGGSCA